MTESMRKSQVAGVLLLLSFVSSLVEFLRVMFIDGMWDDANSGSEFAGLAMLAVVFRLFFLLLSIFILVGAISALFMKSFVLSLVGASIGLFTVGLFYTNIILAIPSLVLLIMGRDEFDEAPRYGAMTGGYPQAPPGSFPPPSAGGPLQSCMCWGRGARTVMSNPVPNSGWDIPDLAAPVDVGGPAVGAHEVLDHALGVRDGFCLLAPVHVHQVLEEEDLRVGQVGQQHASPRQLL